MLLRRREQKRESCSGHQCVCFRRFLQRLGEILTEERRNFIQLTLHTSKDKDDKGAYQPSLWFTVKALSRDGDEPLVNKLAAITKGNLLLSLRLEYHEIFLLLD